MQRDSYEQYRPTLQNTKVAPQRIMVKTTQKLGLPFSVIFSIIVY